MNLRKHIVFFITVGYIAVGALAAYVLFKYMLGWVAPFLLAWALAALLHPAVKFLMKKLRINGKVISIAVILLFLGAVIAVLGMLASRIVAEITNFAKNISVSDVQQRINTLTATIVAWFDDFPEIQAKAVEFLDGFFSRTPDMLLTLSSAVVSLIAAVASALPSVSVFIIVFVVSCFYFMLEFEGINRFIVAQLPEKWRAVTDRLSKQTGKTVLHLAKAYFTLMTLTFIELSLALLILNIDYAVTLALIISVIDLMPVLGVGTALIPWAVVELIIGNYALGIGLLISYVIILIVRQIVEPRIVGKHIGLHPLITLISMYAGLKIFGAVGLFLLPMLVMFLKYLQDLGTLQLWKPVLKNEKEM